MDNIVLVNAIRDYNDGNITDEEFIVRLQRIETPDESVLNAIELHKRMKTSLQVVVNQL
jgi:hypothetical protein